jgi:hypothetical protein
MWPPVPWIVLAGWAADTPTGGSLLDPFIERGILGAGLAVLGLALWKINADNRADLKAAKEHERERADRWEMLFTEKALPLLTETAHTNQEATRVIAEWSRERELERRLREARER